MANRSDTFDRADSTTALGTPSDGGSDWVADTGTWGIATNRGRNVGGASNEVARLAGAAAVVNVKADFPTLAGGDCGLTCRSADGSNYWFIRIRTSTSQLLLRKVVAGTFTTEQTTGSITTANDDTWELDVDSANDYRVYRTPSGGSRVQVNTTYAGGTNLASNTGVGLYAQSDNGSRWDNFVATDPAAGGGGSPKRLLVLGIGSVIPLLPAWWRFRRFQEKAARKPSPARRLIVLATLLGGAWLAVLHGQTSTHGMTIPSTHPRLWWTAERISRAQTWYASNNFSPRGTGNGVHLPAYDNALLFVLTGTGSYCDTAYTHANNWTCSSVVCTTPDQGVASDPYRTDTNFIAFALDWCWNEWTAGERDTIIDRLDSYHPNINAHAWGDATMPSSNYNWGYARTFFLYGITAYEDGALSEDLLDWSLDERWPAIKTFFADTDGGAQGGIVTEGSNYGTSVGYFINWAASADTMGRDLWNETNWFREFVYWMVYGTTKMAAVDDSSGVSNFNVFPFSDDQRWNDGTYIVEQEDHGGPDIGSMMRVMAEKYGSEDAGKHARTWVTTVNPSIYHRHITASYPSGDSKAFSTLPLDYAVPGSFYLYGNASWTTTSTQFHWQLGENSDEGHGHEDMGSFTIFRNGRWLTRETTGYSSADEVTNYAGSACVDPETDVAHNVLLINGTSTYSPKTNTDTAAYYDALRLESATDYAYGAVDMSGGYTNATTVIREMLFLRELETTVILDRLNANFAKDFLIHCYNPWSIDDPNDIAECGPGGSQELRVYTLLPANPTYTERNEATGCDATGQDRLQIQDSTTGQTYFLHVLQAKGTADANLTVSLVDNGSTWTLTLDHPTLTDVEIVLTKGMASTGGTVQKAGGPVQSLRSSVMPITVTANGPVWGTAVNGTRGKGRIRMRGKEPAAAMSIWPPRWWTR